MTKSLFIYALCLLPLLPSAAYAGKKDKRAKPVVAEKIYGSIRGGCTVVVSDSNPLSGPCADLLLVLTDVDGNEVVKTRTTTAGLFDFISEPDKSYKIVSLSKAYETVAPVGVVHNGDRVAVQLRLK